MEKTPPREKKEEQKEKESPKVTGEKQKNKEFVVDYKSGRKMLEDGSQLRCDNDNDFDIGDSARLSG